MTMWNNKAFTEHELSLFGKIAVIVLFVVPTICITIQNIIKGEVANPYAFAICIAGFALLFIAKVSLFAKGQWISFGTKKVSENIANLYRVGYWLMAVGLIFTFFE